MNRQWTVGKLLLFTSILIFSEGIFKKEKKRNMVHTTVGRVSFEKLRMAMFGVFGIEIFVIPRRKDNIRNGIHSCTILCRSVILEVTRRSQ